MPFDEGRRAADRGMMTLLRRESIEEREGEQSATAGIKACYRGRR
jgi:hypothetical protein